jgi:hypothetical protein
MICVFNANTMKTIATAHWPHEEAPAQFNSILLNWLSGITFPKS